MAFREQIGRLAVDLSLDTAQFEQGAKEAENATGKLGGAFDGFGDKVKSLGSGFANFAASFAGAFTGVLIGAALENIGEAVRGAIQFATELNATARAANLTVEQLQRLTGTFERLGIDGDKAIEATQELNAVLGELSLGETNQATRALESLGLGLDQLNVEDRLPTLIRHLSEMEDRSQALALAMQILGEDVGRDFAAAINASTEELDAAIAASSGMIEVTTANAEALDRAGVSWESFKQDITDAVANIVGVMIRFGEVLDAVQASVAAFRQNVITGFREMGASAVQAIENMMTGIRDALIGQFNSIVNSVTRKVDILDAAFKGLWDAVTRNSYIPDMLDDIAYEFGPRMEAAMVHPALTAIQTVKDAFQNLYDSVTKGGFLDILQGLLTVGFQLGSIGLFGGRIQDNLIGSLSQRSGIRGGIGTPDFEAGPIAQPAVINNSTFADVFVDGKIAAASPATMVGASRVTQTQLAYAQSRSLG